MHSLSKLAPRVNIHSWLPPPPSKVATPLVAEVPRIVFLLDSTALCLTDQGLVGNSYVIPLIVPSLSSALFAGRGWAGGEEAAWFEICRDAQFSGYSVGALSPHGSRTLALGSISGMIRLLRMDKNGELGVGGDQNHFVALHLPPPLLCCCQVKYCHQYP